MTSSTRPTSSDAVPKGRDYDFRRPWGLPVRYHDIETLTADCTPDFLEFHFSYKDLEIDPAPSLRRLPDRPADGVRLPRTPTCSPATSSSTSPREDDAHWERSITELQRVIDLDPRRCGRYFTDRRSTPVVIVAAVGGFTTDRHVAARRAPGHVRAGRRRPRPGRRLRRAPVTARPCRPTRGTWVASSTATCSSTPPTPPSSRAATARRLCLDVSHTKLAATFLGQPFAEAVELLAPHTEHLHLVDAAGSTARACRSARARSTGRCSPASSTVLAPGVGFIPEIWQGHVNDGEGFWLALERLEEWF